MASLSRLTTIPSALLLAFAPAVHAGEVERPNILLIVLDDVGLDKLSMYGHLPIQGGQWGREYAAELPNLERLQSNGVRFQHAYAAPQCTPTRAQILSGGYGHQSGVLTLATRLDDLGLPGTDGLLPNVLKSAEYRTGAFGKWHLAAPLNDACHVFDCGFDVFRGHMGNNELGRDHFDWDYKVVEGLPPYSVPLTTCPTPIETISHHWDAAQTCLDARRFIDRFRTTSTSTGDQVGNSWFAYVAVNAPHQTWQLPPRESISMNVLGAIKDLNGWTVANLGSVAATDAAYDAATGPGLGLAPTSPGPCSTDTPDGYKLRLYYRAMLESVDHYIGQLLGSSGSVVTDLENTVILVVGDNGTPLEAMQAVPSPAAPLPTDLIGAPYPLNHGKRWAYELGIQVPLLAYGPPAWIGHGPSDGLVSTVDLWSTLTELAGIVPTSPPVHSSSFAYWLRDPAGLTPPAAPVRSFVYQEIGLANGNNQCWDGQQWYACDNPSTSVTPANRFRVVVHSSGWKFYLRAQPSDCGGPPCGPTCLLSTIPGAMTTLGCNGLTADHHEYHQVFGSGAVIQPNELIHTAPSAQLQRDLRCEMFRINGF